MSIEDQIEYVKVLIRGHERNADSWKRCNNYRLMADSRKHARILGAILATLGEKN